MSMHFSRIPPSSFTSTMNVDPAHMSRVSRRKLHCACDDNRDTSLRRIVLIQNSLVSAQSISSPPPYSTAVSPQSSQQPNVYEPADFIFPDPDLSDSETDDDADESDWLDAVLSDLEDDAPTSSVVNVTSDEDEEAEVEQVLDARRSSRATDSSDSTVYHQSSSPQKTAYGPSPPIHTSARDYYACHCDGLPYFDPDDSSSSSDSDDSEPSTPLSTSDGNVHIATNDSHQNVPYYPSLDNKPIAHEDYFSPRHFRPFDSF